MAAKKKESSFFTDPSVFATDDPSKKFARVMDYSHRMVTDFWARQTKQMTGMDFQFFDPYAAGRAFMELGAQMMANPSKYESMMSEAVMQHYSLMQTMLERMAGKQVSPVIDLPVARLLGGHVRQLAAELPRTRAAAPSAGLGDAEVDDLDPAVHAHQQVVRRHVAMHELHRVAVGIRLVVRGGQAPAGVGHDLQHGGQR